MRRQLGMAEQHGRDHAIGERSFGAASRLLELPQEHDGARDDEAVCGDLAPVMRRVVVKRQGEEHVPVRFLRARGGLA